jgi:hypothetical protein
MSTRPASLDLSDKVAIAADPEQEGKLADVAIGKLVFFQLSKDLLIPPDALKEAMARHGIDERYMPKAPNPPAVLKGLLEKAKYEIPVEGQRYGAQYFVKLREGGAISANLVRLRDEDDTADELSMAKVATVAWAPEMGTAIASRVDPRYADEHPYHERIAELAEEFAVRSTHYSNTQVSSIVSKILNESMSIPTRPKGGVWLVPKPHIELLGRVEAFVNEIDERFTGEEGGETEFNSVILADGRHNRLYIAGRVERQVAKDIAAAIDGLESLRASGVAITPAGLANAAAARRDAMALRDYYSSVTEGDMKDVNEVIDRFEQVWAELTAVKTP